ncbi:MAG: type II toxin-antitoxin system RelE/ParE family toxin [Gemmatimonas sp.]|nr:type II toxin-antitoxin system RelE/ParE family toxin [Gemmatimonas sp.]
MRARDLAAAHAFVSRDSPHYADLLIAKLIRAAVRATRFPESGRMVPKFSDPLVREMIESPYRVVYRLVGPDSIHILTVHHAARGFPTEL